MKAPRFTGIGSFMRLPQVSDMNGVDAAILGIPFDTGVSYRVGGRFGPAAIREASRLLRPYHVEHEIEIFDHLSVVDAGDLSIIPGNIQVSYQVMVDGLRPILGPASFHWPSAVTTRSRWASCGRSPGATAR